MLDKIDAFGCDRFLHRSEKLRQLVSVGLEATTPAGDHDAAIDAAEHRLRALPATATLDARTNNP